MTGQQIATWLSQTWQSLASWFSAACSATGNPPPAHSPHFDATLNGKSGIYIEDAFRGIGRQTLSRRILPFRTLTENCRGEQLTLRNSSP